MAVGLKLTKSTYHEKIYSNHRTHAYLRFRSVQTTPEKAQNSPIIQKLYRHLHVLMCSLYDFLYIIHRGISS